MSISVNFLFFILAFSGNLIYSQLEKSTELLIKQEQFEKELLFSHEKASKTADQIIQSVVTLETQSSIGLMHYIKAVQFLKITNQLDSARTFARSAFNIHSDLKDTTAIFKDLHVLYETFKVEEQYDSLFTYATKQVDIAEKIRKPVLKSIAYLDMGDVYYLTKQHAKTKSYRQKALQVAKRNNLKKELADIHLKLAQSHLKLSKQRTNKVLDSAIFHGKKALRYAEEADYKFGRYKITVRLADLLNVRKKSKEALALIETVIDLPEKEIPLGFKVRAPFYYAAILKDNREYSRAKEITKEIILGLGADDHNWEQSAYYLMNVLYAYNNQPDSADYALKQAIIAGNAGDEIRINKAMAELQTRFETNKKQQKINNLEQNRRLEQLKIQNLSAQRYFLFILLFLLLTGGAWFVNRKRLKMKLATERNELSKQTSELKALRSQMDPHFIFNALNSIQDYIIDSEKEKASEYLGQFADLIRRYLVQSNSDTISLQDEIESLKIYLNLEALRFSENFDYRISQSHNLERSHIYIPTMLVQPYVENAIRHGLLHKKGRRKLLVNFIKGKENTVTCIIEDNGVGREKTKAFNKIKHTGHTSFAEKATAERLELYSKKVGGRIDVEIIDLYENGIPCGTKVILMIPILD